MNEQDESQFLREKLKETRKDLFALIDHVLKGKEYTSNDLELVLPVLVKYKNEQRDKT